MLTFAFFAPLITFTALVIAVACEASIATHSGRMASPAGCVAMIDAGPLFVNARLWVGQVEIRREPGCGGMAIRATGAERPDMEIRVRVASYTLGRKTSKLTGDMAGFTYYVDMRAI